MGHAYCWCRARGVTATQDSVQVPNAGSNPAGSILPLVEDLFWGENTEIISPSNLTLQSTLPILIVDRVPDITDFNSPG